MSFPQTCSFCFVSSSSTSESKTKPFPWNHKHESNSSFRANPDLWPLCLRSFLPKSRIDCCFALLQWPLTSSSFHIFLEVFWKNKFQTKFSFPPHKNSPTITKSRLDAQLADKPDSVLSPFTRTYTIGLRAAARPVPLTEFPFLDTGALGRPVKTALSPLPFSRRPAVLLPSGIR